MSEEWDFPEVELTDAERTWLRAVYSRFEQGRETVPRLLKHQMRDDLPDGFDPREMDQRILANGSIITLLGIWHVDPTSRFIDGSDRFLRYLRHRARTERRPGEIEFSEISDELGMSVEDLSRCFDLVQPFDIYLGGTGRGGGEGALTVWRSIRLKDRNTLDRLAEYPGLEEWVREYYDSRDPEGQPMRPPPDSAFPSAEAEATHKKSLLQHIGDALTISIGPISIDPRELTDAVKSLLTRDR